MRGEQPFDRRERRPVDRGHKGNGLIARSRSSACAASVGVDFAAAVRGRDDARRRDVRPAASMRFGGRLDASAQFGAAGQPSSSTTSSGPCRQRHAALD